MFRVFGKIMYASLRSQCLARDFVSSTEEVFLMREEYACQASTKPYFKGQGDLASKLVAGIFLRLAYAMYLTLQVD